MFNFTEKSESIYDHIEPKPLEEIPSIAPGASGSDSCSLRRTRSLAVIREETYNDLQISGIRTRRSQLIPRAKLVNRSFFKNRYLVMFIHIHLIYKHIKISIVVCAN